MFSASTVGVVVATSSRYYRAGTPLLHIIRSSPTSLLFSGGCSRKTQTRIVLTELPRAIVHKHLWQGLKRKICLVHDAKRVSKARIGV